MNRILNHGVNFRKSLGRTATTSYVRVIRGDDESIFQISQSITRQKIAAKLKNEKFL
jgi:hypothetical protein